MKKMLTICPLLLVDAFAVARNVVVIGYSSALELATTPFKLALPEPVPERLDLIEHGMPQQTAPRATVTRTERDQRPSLRMFTLPRNDFAY